MVEPTALALLPGVGPGNSLLVYGDDAGGLCGPFSIGGMNRLPPGLERMGPCVAYVCHHSMHMSILCFLPRPRHTSVLVQSATAHITVMSLFAELSQHTHN